MNVENMLKVADLIEQHPECFDMSKPHKPDYECGTSGCIAGYTKLLGPRDLGEAGDYLGLTSYQKEQLFYCGRVWGKYKDELQLEDTDEGDTGCHYSSVKPHHAVTMLRNLASGKWSF